MLSWRANVIHRGMGFPPVLAMRNWQSLQLRRPLHELKPRATFLLLLLLLFLTRLSYADVPVSLAGEWRFSLDRQDAGLQEKWFARSLPQKIHLPGALQAQGFGDDVGVDTQWTANFNDRSWFTSPKYEKYRQPGHIKIPFWLQPDKHYVGVAWYQRDIDIPPEWNTRRVVLTLERAHWQTRVWVDQREIGSNDSLSTPHVYDLGTEFVPGRHQLTLRIDNRMIVDVGIWAHSISDHTQGNWNGIVGKIALSATSPVWIQQVQAFGDVVTKSARIKVNIANATGKPGSGMISIDSQRVPIQWDRKGGAAELDISLGDSAQLWDEFNPALHHLTIRLSGDGIDDQRDATFGLRQVSAEGRDFLLNGRKIFFRGTLECCVFPRTGYPPTDVDSWKRIIRICKSYGLNHIRFHSWCPPEAAFEAADELGFYYSVEIAAWTHVGAGAPIDRWLYQEADRIIAAYGNHPSFILMPYGNEPAGGPERDRYLAAWSDHWKQTDSRRLYTSGSGWPIIPESQYHVTPAPRGPSGWLGKDYRQKIARLNAPVIVHEMGQWCVYPNFDEIPKYTGYLKPHNFEIFRDSLAEHGMLDQAHDFLIASGKLQALCYKEEIEAALRTPGIGGFQLLDLHDFPGQGTALVGVLDAFWDSKGYITPEQWRRFCNVTVPLCRLTRRVWTTDQTLIAQVEVAHFGPAPITNATPEWKITGADGEQIAAGELKSANVPIGSGIALGEIRIDLSTLTAPRKYTLAVGLKGTAIQNTWDLWLYPSTVQTVAPADVLITTNLDQALERLNEGGKVLLLPLAQLNAENPKGSFTPVFWNRQWFPKQACQTLGLLCDARHPALEEFPTEMHSDWQWEDLVSSSRAMVLDDFPRELRPIVQVIDDWNTNRRLAMIFECRTGKGRLLVCSADLTGHLDQRPAARQILSSLVAYAQSDHFRPQVRVSAENLRDLR